MSRLKKAVYIVSGLILMTILAMNIFQFWSVTDYAFNMPPYISQFLTSVFNNEIIRFIAVRYVFWASTLVFFTTLILVLVVIFYPRTYTEFKIGKNNHLLVKKSALESYIKIAIDMNKFMKNPHVSVKVFKRRIKVFVSGEILKTYRISEISNALKEDISNGFKDFLGIEKAIKLKVHVKNITEDEQNKQARVK